MSYKPGQFRDNLRTCSNKRSFSFLPSICHSVCMLYAAKLNSGMLLTAIVEMDLWSVYETFFFFET